MCKSVMKSPQPVQKIARLPGGERSAESCHVCGCHGSSESGQGRRKTQGGKHTAKPFPQNVFGPHTYDTFSPSPFGDSVISLKGKRHRPDQPQSLRPLKVGLESTFCSIRFPPPNSRDTFCLPLSRCPSFFRPEKRLSTCVLSFKAPSYKNTLYHTRAVPEVQGDEILKHWK